MLESKHEVPREKNIMVKSESKEIIPVTIQEKKHHKNS